MSEVCRERGCSKMHKMDSEDQPDVSIELIGNRHVLTPYKTKPTAPITPSPPLWLSKRLLVVILLFFCMTIRQILRNHINVTVVEMTSNKSIINGNITIIQPPEFEWDSTTVALVISIIAYGGLFSLLGGFFVKFLGGSMCCSVFMIISGIATLLHPYALSLNFNLFLACRFVTGLSQTFVYISVTEIYSQWFPLQERSKLVSFSFNGSNVGIAIAYPISGYLAYTWGWKSVFYFTGVLPLIMAVICFIVLKNNPSQDKSISQRELQFILQGTENGGIKTKINSPYKSILTSGPMWAVCCLAFVYMWISTNLGVCLPLYVRDLTQKNTNEVGWISSIPNMVYTVMFPLVGPLMDWFNNRGIMTLTRVHKIMVTVAFSSVAVFFIASTCVSNLKVTLGFFVIIDMLLSTVPLIMEIIVVSIAPDHASIVASLMISFYSLGAIVAATVTGFLIPHHAVQEWNNCFYLASVVAIFGAAIFVKFGSSHIQKWALPAMK